MTDARYLACNPDEPGWIHTPDAVTAEGDCGHRIKVSVSGVHALLTTPGLKTCCIRCIRRMNRGEDVKFVLLPEIAREFKEVTGREITPAFQARVVRWARRIQR